MWIIYCIYSNILHSFLLNIFRKKSEYAAFLNHIFHVYEIRCCLLYFDLPLSYNSLKLLLYFTLLHSSMNPECLPSLSL